MADAIISSEPKEPKKFGFRKAVVTLGALGSLSGPLVGCADYPGLAPIIGAGISIATPYGGTSIQVAPPTYIPETAPAPSYAPQYAQPYPGGGDAAAPNPAFCNPNQAQAMQREIQILSNQERINTLEGIPPGGNDQLEFQKRQYEDEIQKNNASCQILNLQRQNEQNGYNGGYPYQGGGYAPPPPLWEGGQGNYERPHQQPYYPQGGGGYIPRQEGGGHPPQQPHYPQGGEGYIPRQEHLQPSNPQQQQGMHGGGYYHQQQVQPRVQMPEPRTQAPSFTERAARPAETQLKPPQRGK